MKISIRWSTQYENYVKNLTVLVLGWLWSIFRKNVLKISPTCKNMSYQVYLDMTSCSCTPVISVWICKRRFFFFYSCNWNFVINSLTVKETVNSELSDPWKQYLYLGQCKLYLNSTLPKMHWFNFAGSYFFFKPLLTCTWLVPDSRRSISLLGILGWSCFFSQLKVSHDLRLHFSWIRETRTD